MGETKEHKYYFHFMLEWRFLTNKPRKQYPTNKINPNAE
jgi:hypothetical protein